MRLRVGAALAFLCAAAGACGKSGGPGAPAGPRADCAPLAEQLASLELGNYAEAEARAPVVAKWRDACRAQEVTVGEAACIGRATDAWSAAQCAPRLFPQLAAGDTSDCEAVVAKTKRAMLAQASYLNDASIKDWFATALGVMQTSCVEDHWPAALKRCMLSAELGPGSGSAALGVAAFAQCASATPPELQRRMQARLLEAFRKTQRK